MKDSLKRLNIELSAFCNYCCAGCPNTYMTRPKGNMSPELFFSIFDEIRDQLDKVFLWNYGEPLLNPEVPVMLEAIRDIKTQKILSTNGQIIDRFDDLSFLTALDELIVSINGITPKVYKEHQKGGDFDAVVKGLIKLRPYMESSKTDFVLQTVANNFNLSQLDQVDGFAKSYGFKKVVIKTFNVMDNDPAIMQKYVPFGTPYSRYGSKCKAVHKTTNRIEPCLEWMVINWNGDVNLCCWDYEGAQIMGNVKKQGVLEVWNLPTMVKHRQQIKEKNYLPICVNCVGSKIVKERRIL